MFLYVFKIKLFTRVKKLADQLVSDYEKVSNTLHEMGEAFSNFYKSSANFNKNVNIGREPRLMQGYAGMNNICSEMGF